jgi:HEAT repeat protein
MPHDYTHWYEIDDQFIHVRASLILNSFKFYYYFKALSHCNYNVRLAAAEALAAALDENPDCLQVCLIIYADYLKNNLFVPKKERTTIFSA